MLMIESLLAISFVLALILACSLYVRRGWRGCDCFSQRLSHQPLRDHMIQNVMMKLIRGMSHPLLFSMTRLVEVSTLIVQGDLNGG